MALRVFKQILTGGGKLLKPFTFLINIFIKEHPVFLVSLLYRGDIWKLRESCISKRTSRKELLYYSYLQTYGAWIGLGAQFDGTPIFPHSFNGIFISHNAHIGKNVTIFHQVTIGSNMTVGSKNQGSPTICNNVYIGCGAKIIGKCNIGDNVRVGANCIITKDVPSNCVCVMRGLDIIQKEGTLDNTWIAVNG